MKVGDRVTIPSDRGDGKRCTGTITCIRGEMVCIVVADWNGGPCCIHLYRSDDIIWPSEESK